MGAVPDEEVKVDATLEVLFVNGVEVETPRELLEGAVTLLRLPVESRTEPLLVEKGRMKELTEDVLAEEAVDSAKVDEPLDVVLAEDEVERARLDEPLDDVAAEEEAERAELDKLLEDVTTVRLVEDARLEDVLNEVLAG